MQKLANKVAIITGASNPKGIGSAIARRLAGEGANLLLVAEGPEDQLKAVAAECRTLGDGVSRVEAELYDLEQPTAAEAMVETALKHFGRIDILVNNAAVRARKRFEEFSRQDFRQTVAVNLETPFFASKAAIPAMRKQGGGRIIHIASQMGLVAADERMLYGMTKAALIYLARAMAYELAADGILVNAISPGPIDTATSNPETVRKLLGYLRTSRRGTPEEIAEVALFLATAAPEFMIGQNIVVDGGYTLH
jgi:NAD(P)-dependent dehydrogenase (short-subunit alcohol dehydrogenase family)